MATPAERSLLLGGKRAEWRTHAPSGSPGRRPAGAGGGRAVASPRAGEACCLGAPGGGEETPGSPRPAWEEFGKPGGQGLRGRVWGLESPSSTCTLPPPPQPLVTRNFNRPHPRGRTEVTPSAQALPGDEELSFQHQVPLGSPVAQPRAPGPSGPIPSGLGVPRRQASQAQGHGTRDREEWVGGWEGTHMGGSSLRGALATGSLPLCGRRRGASSLGDTFSDEPQRLCFLSRPMEPQDHHAGIWGQNGGLSPPLARPRTMTPPVGTQHLVPTDGVRWRGPPSRH